MQVSNGFGGRGVDQPQAGRQTGSGADPQTPHPVKWTYLVKSGQEKLLHHQVARSLRPSAAHMGPLYLTYRWTDRKGKATTPLQGQ